MFGLIYNNNISILCSCWNHVKEFLAKCLWPIEAKRPTVRIFYVRAATAMRLCCYTRVWINVYPCDVIFMEHYVQFGNKYTYIQNIQVIRTCQETCTYFLPMPFSIIFVFCCIVVWQRNCGKMASLIPDTGVLVNYAHQAPSPLKDYCQILVTWDKVSYLLRLDRYLGLSYSRTRRIQR